MSRSSIFLAICLSAWGVTKPSMDSLKKLCNQRAAMQQMFKDKPSVSTLAQQYTCEQLKQAQEDVANIMHQESHLYALKSCLESPYAFPQILLTIAWDSKCSKKKKDVDFRLWLEWPDEIGPFIPSKYDDRSWDE